jgi:hypothetical protein
MHNISNITMLIMEDSRTTSSPKALKVKDRQSVFVEWEHTIKME